MGPAVRTLFLPFTSGSIAPPSEGEHWLFLNAQILPEGIIAKSQLSCVQSFKPDYNQLKQAGYPVSPELTHQSGQASGALISLGRFRRLNEFQVALANQNLPAGSPILVAGEKTDGIASLRKWASKQLNVLESHSKNHCQVFVLESGPSTNLKALVDSFDPQSGVFGQGKVDGGSALLAEKFDEGISGSVADFCSGTGYLSEQLLTLANPGSIDLYEADFHALEISRQSIQPPDREINHYWLDLTQEPVNQGYDWIVMNPPFHTGRAAEPQLGQHLIRVAAQSLKKGGRLRLVANRNLPYESVLAESFGKFEQLAEKRGFKVLQARKQ